MAYLLRSPQPVFFKFEGEAFRVTIDRAVLFPQGYAALATQPDLVKNEPSVLLMDVGGWTVDMMRLDLGRPASDTCRSNEMGVIRCFSEAREQVLRATRQSVTDM